MLDLLHTLKIIVEFFRKNSIEHRRILSIFDEQK